VIVIFYPFILLQARATECVLLMIAAHLLFTCV